MAWEQRSNRTYYYAKQRVGSKVKSTYLGTGPQAHQEHQRIQTKHHEDQEWQQLESERNQLEAQVQQALKQAGLHRQNYGPWRKKTPKPSNAPS